MKTLLNFKLIDTEKDVRVNILLLTKERKQSLNLPRKENFLNQITN